MEMLVTYDVNTLTTEGRRRLRRVAKICQGYGQRVQFSVFECSVNEAQKEKMTARLVAAIDKHEDSLRLYRLHTSGKSNAADAREAAVECFGLDRYVDFKAPLIL